ncbi:MAG: hypothetical protein U0183_09105 [Polyangiaceae bacterium]
MTDDVRRLDGYGAGLIREIALAERVKAGLSRLYRLGELPHVGDFVTLAEGEEREAVFVRDAGDALEIELRVPKLAAESDTRALDPLCQIIEGVSHFVYLAARAERKRETTQLELEIQAEVDKYVVLAHGVSGFSAASSERLRRRLYEGVSYVHDEGTHEGERYRVANGAAHRFTERIERKYVGTSRVLAMREELRAFFEMGLEEKLRAARGS